MRNVKSYVCFLALLLVFLVALGEALVYIPKGTLHLLMAGYHTPALDLFFRYYTQVGEWVPYVVCALLLFYRAGWSAFTLAGTLLSGLTTQVLKHLVDAPRPLTWFATHYPDVQLPLVEGVRMSQYFSFPSGHTTSFFALFFALAVMVSEMPWSKTRQYVCQVLFFCLADLGGYSRVYLSQHFAIDVWAGAAIGTLITALLMLALPRLKGQKWWSWHIKIQKNAVFCKKNA